VFDFVEFKSIAGTLALRFITLRRHRVGALRGGLRARDR
jgi:hypothetical protein